MIVNLVWFSVCYSGGNLIEMYELAPQVKPVPSVTGARTPGGWEGNVLEDWLLRVPCGLRRRFVDRLVLGGGEGWQPQHSACYLAQDPFLAKVH